MHPSSSGWDPSGKSLNEKRTASLANLLGVVHERIIANAYFEPYLETRFALYASVDRSESAHDSSFF